VFYEPCPPRPALDGGQGPGRVGTPCSIQVDRPFHNPTSSPRPLRPAKWPPWSSSDPEPTDLNEQRATGSLLRRESGEPFSVERTRLLGAGPDRRVDTQRADQTNTRPSTMRRTTTATPMMTARRPLRGGGSEVDMGGDHGGIAEAGIVGDIESGRTSPTSSLLGRRNEPAEDTRDVCSPGLLALRIRPASHPRPG
jgi:hypothetical protein